MIHEKWKPVPGYEANYIISESGIVMRSSKKRGTHIGKIVKSHTDKKGYTRTRLTNGEKASTLKVHRLVAMAYISNPHNLSQVNHKDTDKSNNHYSNLEWCTNPENKTHAMENGICPKAWLGKKGKDHNRSIPIVATNKSTGEQKDFFGSWEAARELGLLQGSIANVLAGRVKTTVGWTFQKK